MLRAWVAHVSLKYVLLETWFRGPARCLVATEHEQRTAVRPRLAGLRGRLQNRLRPEPCQTVLHPRLRLWNASGAPRFPLVSRSLERFRGGGATFSWLRPAPPHFFPTIPPVIAAAEIERGGGRRCRQRPAARSGARGLDGAEAAGARAHGGAGRGGGRWSAARGRGGAEAAGVGARGQGGADDGHRRGAARGEEGGRRGAGSLRRRWRELTALEGVRNSGEEGARGEEGGRRGRRKWARRRRSE